MTFQVIAGKLKEELIDIIRNSRDVNDYEQIVFKYVFISELKIPLFEEIGIEIADDSFILYIIPDNLEFNLLKDLAEEFKEFDITFMPNSYGVLKLNFRLGD